jgi:hypothetical protein
MRTLPDYSYESEKRKEKRGEGRGHERLDADDPKNNDRIEKILFGNG